MFFQRILRSVLFFVSAASLVGVAGFAAAADDVAATPLTPEQSKFFETKIRPVLVRECYGCHSKQAGQSKGGLRLDTQAAMIEGGDSGPAIVPGDLDASLFFGAITHTDFVMPPKRKLTDAEIADFRTWILDGAPDPRVITPVETPAQTIDDEMIAQAKRTFWAYQAPRRSRPPEPDAASTHAAAWSKTTIDRFLAKGLDDAGLQPAADAPAANILRRLCFDLIGLPPTPEQLEWFTAAYAQNPDAAVARVVDRLLDSHQFGEHWGRHWLDVVRYGESTGREVNMTYPNAWRYRDYVIDSVNADKPYDEFVQEQIAGDLLPAADDDEWSEHLVATGFLAIGTKNVNEQSGAQFAADLADEQIDATTRVFLGTSVACARCHDHKFDPIRQTDYYAMAGIFRSTKTFFGTPPSQYGSFGGPQQRRISSLILLPTDDPDPAGRSYSPEELEQLHQDIRDRQAELVGLRRGESATSTRRGASPQQMRIRLTNELGTLSAKLGVVDENGQPRSYCMGVQDADTVGDAPLLVRGEIDQPAGRIKRGLPAALSDVSFSPKPGASGRLELARWIGSDDNTLAARVMVNRIWQHVFGQGIVPTTEDFGMTGTAPSHPELLDHLAIEFIESDWSVKTMIRQMMLTRAYRMQSTFDVASHEADPDNRLLWRANVKRLNAESLRDAMLVIAGELETEPPTGSKVAQAGYSRVRDGQLGDPRDAIRRTMQTTLTGRTTLTSRRGGLAPIFDRIRNGNPREQALARNQLRSAIGNQRMAELAATAYDEGSLDSVSDNHRSVYLPVVRDFVPRSLDVFDFADPSMVIGTRETSNTPNQALYMLNNPLTIRLSEAFAERLLQEGRSTKDRVEMAFVLAYGRPPTAAERTASHRFLSSSGLLPKSALAAFCQSLFAAAEFRYLN
ncbi:Planctomycete cytochrome C [Stieleria magnilauensis]|uniref:Planctomycete cytochrome C n=1 Tax=Stieleria magnilauensis TaxID=2527963 RepID=A0ABX5XMH8_9BACT|nr:Planctomycete cytochrome C [Planctomycetes bacterium TBK1r]